MADEKSGKGDGPGPFELGRCCEVDSRLGSLHESRNAATGTPALTLVPREGVEWQPEGACRMRLIYEPERDSVDAHLSSGPVPGLGSRDSRVRRVGPSRTWLAAGVVVLVVGLGVWSLLWPHALEPLRVDGAPGESLFFADGQDLALAVIAYPMPETPFKEQRKPPCLEGTETEIRGGCWIQHKLDAPCPRNTAEYQGKCFIPVKKPEPLPRSVLP
ncbi:hypothetical protein CYFUS_008300 [Cystobacter fuscus]|uniref:Protein kinase n=1 Tax=Cystobacter fuscus TaxID=43 RepID=A0A250JHD9_9BACT|nr:hypothetical protein [Cystobacter fuscus]ATB42821.1 hypothetical protein CYFUS_008300 [Cystobacter fuscus]